MEHLLVPGQGFVFADTGWSAGENFVALGPIAQGCIVERIHFLLNATTIPLIDLSAVMTGSSNASLAAFQSGVPLLRAAQVTSSGVPAIEVIPATEGFDSITLPVGIRVSGGSKWVHFSYESSDPASTSGVFSVWVLDERSQPRVPGVSGGSARSG